MTRRQKQLIEFIGIYQDKHGISPSYDEMAEGLGLKSKSGVHRLVRALEEMGHIVHHHHRARAISIIKVDPTPEDAGIYYHLVGICKASRDGDERALSLRIAQAERFITGSTA